MKRRRNKPKSGRLHARSGAPPTPAHSQSIPPLTSGRKWLFRLIALLLPLLALGGLEAALRLTGYGHPTLFFKKLRVGHQEFLVDNDKVGLRFFPPELVRMPAPVLMKAKKPTGAYRIFILGESAALGDPEPAFGAGRYLETLLRERFRAEKFEVVNVAMTAINSHAILPIARECANHEGDLWIIYMGNNEMVGPFGAATIFGARAPPLAFVRLSLAIQKTRVGQLLTAWSRKIKGKSSSASSWAGMQMFLRTQIPPDDPHKTKVYSRFERNLQDILRVGLDSGARIILSTVAVNFKDSPPFVSLRNTNLPAADLAQFDKLYEQGGVAESQGHFAEAAQSYEQAAKLDPRFAELQFRWGDCLLRLTNTIVARQHFQLACDYDALPFRTDSRLNGLITQVGQRAATPDVRLLDAVAALETNSPVGILGQESFYEHVHFNFDGNYRLARAWAEQVEHFLPVTTGKRNAEQSRDREGAPASFTNRATSGWASQEMCERWLGLTDWNRRHVIDEVIRRMQRAPLSAQSNNARRLAALQTQVKEIRQRMDAAAAVKAREVYLEALKRAPDDFYLHENYADFLVATDDLKQAAAEWQRVCELIPHDYLAYFRLGGLLALQGKLAEAQSALFQSVALRPGFSDSWLELGKIHAAEGKLELALKEYDRARLLEPQSYRAHYYMGKALSLLNRRAQSIQHLREAVRLKPEYWEAHYALGGALGYDARITEAKRAFEEVIRLKPDYAMAYLNLGVALMKQGHLDEAERRFQETLRLEPENKFARDYLGQVQTLKNHQP